MTNFDNMKASINTRIDELKEAEKITKSHLASLSRDVLTYVLDSDDIDCVNRLIGVLTPMNRTAAIMYFSHFLPWQVEKDTDKNFVRFGKRFKSDVQIKKRVKMIYDWLSVETNTIWTWADDNIEVKQKDLKGNLEKAIKKAMEGDEKTNTPPVPHEDIILTFLASGISLDLIMSTTATVSTTPEIDSRMVDVDIPITA